ncbi:hypothetical protein TIFTF001_031781 [Ficus carica]|uniref:Uncharacterized protein n=1 Tax=Ficus carica TaxID=3494 RepID=A0AA88J6S1_FICCA|nr:hypothetical protein TIFTF001_031781 [Ficus carica]
MPWSVKSGADQLVMGLWTCNGDGDNDGREESQASMAGLSSLATGILLPLLQICDEEKEKGMGERENREWEGGGLSPVGE